jgi:hypothetical protein
MSQGRTAVSPAARMGSGAGRLVKAWRVMPRERRLAAYAAVGLFVSMFLPWYQRQFFVVVGGRLVPGSDSQTAWAQFSFVEAAVLLVAAGVLTLLFQRAEGKAFHLPGGDGWVITAAGGWTCALIVWRIFDKQGGSAHGLNATTYGIEWGIFVALAIAATLAYAGSRIRASHRPEPPLPGENAAGTAPAGTAAGTATAGTAPNDTAPTDTAAADTAVAATAQTTRPAQPRRRSRERGWLTAPRDPQARWSGEPPPEWSGQSPPEFSGPQRPPRPIPAHDPDAAGEDPTIPVAPSTRAARRDRRRPPPDDEQLTTPLD